MCIWIIIIALINTGTILSCPQNCEECLAPDGRSRCTNGYYLDGDQWIRCPDQDCKTCRGARQCTRCLEGYYLEGHQCTQCPQQCATCTGSDRCISCMDGYYLDGHKCKQCSQECATCTGPYICTRCTDGYYLAIHRCTRCPQECAICTGPYMCTRCTDGFYQDRHRCKPLCPQGCATCPVSDQCTRCTEGYYLDRHYQCKQCQQGCETCTGPDQCINCTEGYCFNGSECKECHRCPDKCHTCVQSTTCSTSSSCKPTAYCTSCKAGYFGYHCQPCRNCKDDVCSHDGQCILGCKNGSYVSTNGCERCPYKCLTCTSPTVCTSCSLGYGSKCDQPCRNCKNNSCSKYGQCTDGCIDGHYQGTTGCDPCPANCSSCRSVSLCDQCNPGFHGPTCKQNCPHTCISCTSDRNCSACKDGYFGQSCENECSAICKDGCNKVDGVCSWCIDGYYKKGKQCTMCSKGCARCQNVDVCKDCQSGFFREQVLNGVNCITCGQNCYVCKTKDSCTTCNQGHVNVKGGCLPCHNCEDFKTCSSQSTCPQCIDGFWEQYCGDKCNDTCKRCNKTTGECTECKGHTFGRYCELKCSSNCLQSSDNNSSCWQHNGTCTDGCMQGFTGTDCTEEIPPQASVNFTLIVGSILGGIIVMVSVVIVGFCMWRRASVGPSGQAAQNVNSLQPVYINYNSQTQTVRSTRDFTDSRVGLSLARMNAARVATPETNESLSERGRESRRIYTSIDDVGTDSEQDNLTRTPMESTTEYLQRHDWPSSIATRPDEYESLRRGGQPSRLYSQLHTSIVTMQSSIGKDDGEVALQDSVHQSEESGMAPISDQDESYYNLPSGEYQSLHARREASATYTSLQEASGSAAI